ncbi:MAG: DNA repair exonuclease [Acidobacteria bacterium]|jgi:DNA repair exonuclease SbcCD nuclease subunit|nr:DNA repair exonuclease [Acidobacteriota bacterium]
MKFLHISDVHLGCTRYQLNESPRDFFDAWIDVLQKYAIGERVDFVIMGGDFFHKRNVPPETMNYAFAGLSLLKDNGIPCVTIEGNHDQKANDTDFSWLRSLANWNLLYLLEPTNENGKVNYKSWNEDNGKGGFVDIGNARIFGSHWYGASANWAIPMLTEAIKENRRTDAFHILLLHTDVEGHQTHPIPALSLANLKELKSVTDYVALGHTHKSYEIDNWAFNPGSLEITSIDEFRETRGAFLIDVGENNEVNATHLRDYRQRPFQRLSFDVSGYAESKEITEAVLELVEREAKTFDANAPRPIYEITLRGHLGFPNSNLELQKIREEARELTDALHVRIKNHSAPIEYAVAADVGEDVSREMLERRVVEDLIIRDNRYKTRVEEMADAVVGAKRLALSDETPDKIVDFIALKLEQKNEARA